MLDIFNLVLAFLTLTFYFNKVIEKFTPCLNIILLSLFLIAYSMSNTQYLLAAIVIIIVFYFVVPNNNENFTVKKTTYHLIDTIDTILLSETRRNDKSKPLVYIKLDKKDIMTIKKNGKYKYKGESNWKDLEMVDNKFDTTQNKDNGWRIVKNINNLGDQPTKEQEMNIFSIQKSGNGFGLVRMDSSQEKNEEEYIMNKLVQHNKKQGNEIDDDTPQNTEMGESSAMKQNKEPGVMETFVSKKKNKKDKKKKSSKKKRKSYGFNDDFNVDESFINNKETLGDVYRSLDPDQAKGLNSDTKELLETQKNLMNTLKEMGPVLTQGKDIMNTFNKYFGKTK